MQHLNLKSATTGIVRSRVSCQIALAGLLLMAMVVTAYAGGAQETRIEDSATSLPATPRLASMENFRDLAGADAASVYRNAEGRALRRGVFYRSNAVIPDDADWAILNGLGIRAVYDLRTPGEIAKAPDRVPLGAEYVHVNVIGSEDIEPPAFTSAAQAEKMLEEAERSMVTDADMRARLGHLLTTMAATEGAQVFHCTAGKDRTGWVAALLHTIAGVPEERIVNDYLLTNTYARNWMDKARQAIRDEHGQAMADAAAPLLGVQESFLQAGFDQVLESYGSMDDYIRDGLGLDAKTLQALRDKLLE